MTEADLKARILQTIGLACVGPGCDFDEETSACSFHCGVQNHQKADRVMALLQDFIAGRLEIVPPHGLD